MSNMYLISIGCSEYKADSLENLKYAGSDAKLFYDCYRDSGTDGFSDENSFELYKVPPEYRTVGRDLSRVLKKAKLKDTVVFYFAGHGVVDESDTLYLALHDTELDALDFSAISTSKLLSQFDDCRAQRKILILDCCHSGAIIGQGRGAENAGMLTELENHTGQGTVILTSCQETEQAREVKDLGHGVFTYYIVEGLKGAADENRDGVITKDELYNYVTKSFNEKNITQTPKDISNVGGGSFYLLLSSEKRKEQEVALEIEVAELKNKKLHMSALELLKNYPDKPFDLSDTVARLTSDVEKGMRDETKMYRDRLFDEAKEGDLSQSVQSLIIKKIENDDSFLFHSTKNLIEKHIRHHYRRSVESVALNDLVIDMGKVDGGEDIKLSQPDIISKHDTKDELDQINKLDIRDGGLEENHKKSKNKFDKRLAIPSVLISCIVLLMIVILGPLIIQYSDTPAVPKGYYSENKLRFGVLLKDKWTDYNTKLIFSKFLSELNILFKNKNVDFQFDANNVQTFTKNQLNDLLTSFKNGQLEMVGELSPRLIYKVSDLSGEYAVPFISPEYGGVPTYETMIFVNTSSSHFNKIVVDKKNKFGLRSNIQPKLWDKLIEKVKYSDVEVALLEENSTSGYWYPKHHINQALGEDYTKNPTKLNKLAMISSEQEILESVSLGTGKIIAGAMAVYKFKELCINGINKIINAAEKEKQKNICSSLYAVKKIKNIPNGAFLIRKQLSNSSFSRLIRNNWEQVVSGYIDKDTSLGAKKYFKTKSWISVDLPDYKSALNIVAADDIYKISNNNIFNRFAYVAALFVVLVILLMLLAKRSHAK